METKKVDTEIKDCPFCKGKAMAQQSSGCSGGGNKYTIVGCSRCEIGMQTTVGLKHAIGQWNNRPIEDELRLKIKELEDQLDEEIKAKYGII